MSDEDSGLVMPFIVCQSVGGPYDDAAFVAGYECGEIEGFLRAFGGDLGPIITDIRPVHEENLPQLDLIAMRNRFVMDVVEDPERVEGFRSVRFVRSEDKP